MMSDIGHALNNGKTSEDYYNYKSNDNVYLKLRDKIEVIIPTLNEAKTIGYVVESVKKYADKIVIIDGGSYDDTLKVVENYDVIIMKQNGRGKGAALREAFNKVDKEIIFMLDADGSTNPDEIPLFLREMEKGADIVKGSRFKEGGSSKDISPLRKFGNDIFIIIINLLYGMNITDVCYGYMAFTNASIRKINSLLSSNGFDIETEIILKAEKLGFKIVEVPSNELSRVHGVSKLNWLRDGLKILKLILREIF